MDKHVLVVAMDQRHGAPRGGSMYRGATWTVDGPYSESRDIPAEADTIRQLNLDFLMAVGRGLHAAGWIAWLEARSETVRRVEL